MTMMMMTLLQRLWLVLVVAWTVVAESQQVDVRRQDDKDRPRHILLRNLHANPHFFQEPPPQAQQTEDLLLLLPKQPPPPDERERSLPSNPQPLGCHQEPIPQSKSLMTVIGTNPSLDTFEAWLVQSGVANDLSDNDYTVLAPHDVAIQQQQQLPLIQRLEHDPEFALHLQELVRHHLIPGPRLCSSNVPTLPQSVTVPLATSGQQQARLFRNAHGLLLVKSTDASYDWSPTNQLAATKPDQTAHNGVVHGVNRVFWPKWATQTLGQVLLDEEFSTFAQLLQDTDNGELWDLLSGQNNHTYFSVFAPRNQAFAKLSTSHTECLLQTPDLLAQVLRHHIVPNRIVTSEELASGEPLILTTLQSGSVEPTRTTYGTAAISSVNRLATNGIIHVLDDVATFPGYPCSGHGPSTSPTPSPTAVPKLQSPACTGDNRPDESVYQVLLEQPWAGDRFVQWMEDSYADYLRGAGPLTLLVPSNVALSDPTVAQSLPPGRTPDDLWQRLERPDFALHKRDLLLHHIIADDNELCANDLTDGRIVDLANQDQARINKDTESNRIFVRPVPPNPAFGPTGQLELVLLDIPAANGNFFSTNRLFATDWMYQTLDQVLFFAKNSTTFAQWLDASGLLSETVLADETSVFTVFSPSNAALLEAFGSQDRLDCLVSQDDNTALLTALEQYIVVDRAVASAEFLANEPLVLPTLDGGSVTLQNGRFQGASIDSVDLFAYNGVAHLLEDASLLATDLSGVCANASGTDVPTTTTDMPTTSVPTETEPPTVDRLPGPGCDNSQTERPFESLFQVLSSNPTFDTFVDLLRLAELDDELRSGPGPWTILAPTNAAFVQIDEALGSDPLARLQDDPQFRLHLRDLVLHHLVSDQEYCEQTLWSTTPELALANGDGAFVVQGGVRTDPKNAKEWFVAVRPSGGTNWFGPTGQLALTRPTDLGAANGVAHAVNRVFLTRWMYQTVLNVAFTTQENTSTMVTLLQQFADSSILNVLTDPTRKVTLLLPTNQAFDDLDPELGYCLGQNPSVLQDVLMRHVVLNSVETSVQWPTDTDEVQVWPTLLGTSPLLVQYDHDATSEPGIVIDSNARVVERDVLAYNGVVHVINQVLIEPSLVASCGPIPDALWSV